MYELVRLPKQKIAGYCKFCGNPVRVIDGKAICQYCGAVNPPIDRINREEIKRTVITLLRKYPDASLVGIYDTLNYVLGVRVSEDVFNEILVELGLIE